MALTRPLATILLRKCGYIVKRPHKNKVRNMENNNKIIKCYCDSCERKTNHNILASEKMNSKDEEYWWSSSFLLVKCCGCETISFLKETVEERVIDYDKSGEIIYPTHQMTYPNHKRFADPIKNLWPIPSNIVTIYKETINSLNNDCFLLAAAGFRVIIEAICIDNHIKGKSLETKINNLHRRDIITKNDRDRLHSIRFMGNDSVHAIKSPDKQQIRLVLDIIHNMLNGLYVLTDKCRQILEGPIRTYDEFISLLEEGLVKHSVGEVDILKNLLPPSRHVIKEDRSLFESQLKEKISSGEYKKLQLCPPPTAAGKNQQYKILEI